jgi:hypothetical protein
MKKGQSHSPESRAKMSAARKGRPRRPLSPEHRGQAGADFTLAIRRAAVERVQSLFAQHLLRDEVLKVLRSERTLSPQLRDAAIDIAERRSENASGLYEAARLTIVRPRGRPDDYRLALRRLEAACRVVADDPERLAECRHALALALYRAEKPLRAVEMLRAFGADAPGRPPQPMDLVVIAMASHQLGRTDEAHKALEQLRALVKSALWADDPEALEFLRECEEVVESSPAPPNQLR